MQNWAADEKINAMHEYRDLIMNYDPRRVRSVFHTKDSKVQIKMPQAKLQNIMSNKNFSLAHFANHPLNIQHGESESDIHSNKKVQEDGTAHVDNEIIEAAHHGKAFYYCVAHAKRGHTAIIIKTTKGFYSVGLGYLGEFAALYSPDYIFFNLEDAILFDCGRFHAKHVIKLLEFNQMITTAIFKANASDCKLHSVVQMYLLDPNKYRYAKLQSSTWSGMHIREMIAKKMLPALSEGVLDTLGLNKDMVTAYTEQTQNVKYLNCTSFVYDITSNRKCIHPSGFFHPNWCTKVTECTNVSESTNNDQRERQRERILELQRQVEQTVKFYKTDQPLITMLPTIPIST